MKVATSSSTPLSTARRSDGATMSIHELEPGVAEKRAVVVLGKVATSGERTSVRSTWTS